MVVAKPRLAAFPYVVVDPSLRSTGVLHSNSGVIETFSIQSISSRIDVLRLYLDTFRKMARANDWKFLCIEDYSYGSKGRAVTTQAEIGGVIRAVFAAEGIPIIECPIQTWKSITGVRLPKKTARDKAAYIEMVYARTGMRAGTADEADTILMANALYYAARGFTGTAGGVRLRKKLDSIGVEW